MSSSLDALPKIGAPAMRALQAAGYRTLRDLAGVPRDNLSNLHGMGPKALGVLEDALRRHELSPGRRRTVYGDRRTGTDRTGRNNASRPVAGSPNGDDPQHGRP